MKMSEYLEVQRLTYREYCAYLQRKYGIGRSDYMTASWNPRKACKRTDEGLFIHHVFEDHTIMLSHRDWAMSEAARVAAAGESGILQYFGASVSAHPDLRISGKPHGRCRRGRCYKSPCPAVERSVQRLAAENGLYKNLHFELSEADKSVYLELLRRFMNTAYYAVLGDKCLLTSSAAKYGRWSAADNRALFMEVKRL